MHLPSYLHRNRHGIFGFRFVVPLHLRRFFESISYRFSLGTAEKTKAKRLALALASHTTRTFARLRYMTDDEATIAARNLISDINAQLDEEYGPPREIAALGKVLDLNQLSAYVQALCSDEPIDSTLRKLGDFVASFPARIAAIEEAKVRMIKRVQTPMPDGSDPVDNDAFCEEIEAEAAEHMAKHRTLEQDIANFSQAVTRMRLDQQFRERLSTAELASEVKYADFAKFAAMMQQHGAPTTSHAANHGSPSVPEATSSPTLPKSTKPKVLLSEVIDAYCASRVAEGGWTTKTEAENRAIYALWLDIIGDQAVEEYGFEVHRSYKTRLMKLPANIRKRPDCDGKTIDQIIAMKPTPMEIGTVNKNLMRTAALFKWAVSHGYTTLNPASSMTIPDARNARDERSIFEPDDLQKIFGTAAYKNGEHRQSYMHWIPLIALYSGARLNEIAQLHLADFVESEGVPMISFNPEGEHKRIKTRAGVRKVPIHPELIRLGLLAHVRSLRAKGKDRLFPELKPGRDGYGQVPSKWFSAYRRRCGITDGRKVFHSFRHTFTTYLMQADVPKERTAALVGHEDESETFGRYGKSFNVTTLLADVSLVPSACTQCVSAISASRCAANSQ